MKIFLLLLLPCFLGGQDFGHKNYGQNANGQLNFGQADFGQNDSAPNTILSLNPYAYYDASLETASNDDVLSQLTDFSGNGRHLTESVAGKFPVYKTNIINGNPSFDFSSTQRYIRGQFGETLSQPNTIIAVMREVTTTNLYVYDGYDASNRHAYFAPLYYAGSVLSSSFSQVSGEWHIRSGIFDGASSALFYDDQTDATGNTGSNNLTGIIIGARYNVVSYHNDYIAVIVVFDRRLTSDEINSIHNFLNNRYAIY